MARLCTRDIRAVRPSHPHSRFHRLIPATSMVALALLVGVSQARAGDQLAQEFLGAPQPGRERRVPEVTAPAELDFSIQAPRRSPVPRAAEELSFDLRDVTLVGAKAYPAEELRPLIEPIVGKTVHLSDLVGVAEKIEAKYRADGYVLTRVYVPAQSVSNGVFQINVVEGYVAATSVVGGDESTRERVEALLAPVLQSKPLKLPVIEHALLAANDLPGAHASGLLRPSATEPGASDLVVSLSAEPYAVLLSSDNRGSKVNGQWTNSADVAVRSPFGDGGQLLLNVTSALDFDQRRSFQGKYVLPVGDAGTLVSMNGLLSHGQPAAGVGSLELLSNSMAVGPRVTHPLILNRQQKLIVDGGFTWQASDVYISGQPFSHDEWRVLDANLTYQNTKLLGGVSSGTVGVAKGLEMFGASSRFPKTPGAVETSRVGGRPDFTKFSALLRHLRPLGGPWSFSGVITGQYALDPLLTGEEISFGGAMIGRGYDPASITGDHGLGGAFELRYDLDATDFHLDQAQLYTFYDIGKVWWRTEALGNNKLESIGFGLRTVVLKDLSLGVEVAHTMIPVATSDDGKRGTRIFFNGSVKF